MEKDHRLIGHLRQLIGGAPILDITPIFGGHINRAYKLTTDSDTFFVKVNSSQRFPDMFDDEAKGLQLLALAIKKGYLTIADQNDFDRLYLRIP